MTPVIQARGLSKSYNGFAALKDATFTIPLGRIVGVIGSNGAGKTTLLNSILGLVRYDGDLEVLGLNPATHRAALMRDVCFIADVATLPRWMRVAQVLDYVAGVHPRFDRARALDYLARTTVPLDKRVRALSKGMVAQVHLAIVMAVDAKLLVLDEPTLGLDIIFRKTFYANLLEDYFDKERTIIVTTHQVEEVEHILSDVMFIRDGRVVLDATTDALGERFVEVMVDAERADEARAMGPLAEREAFGRKVFVFENPDRDRLAALGDCRRMGLADIFVAKMTGETA